ncbi:MAG: energy transducer TonB [Myxococcota bacterium]
MASTTFESLFGGGIDPQLKRMVALSVCAHLALALLILLMARASPLPVDYRPAIQVALVDLPEVEELKDVKLGAPKPKQLPPPQPKEPAPKKARARPVEPKKKVVAIEEARKTREKANEAKRKKAAEARAKKRKEAERLRRQNTAIARLRQRALDTAMPEGSAGGNVRGTGAIKALAYDAQVRDVLADNWELPSSFLGQNLHTLVFMKLDRSGRIISWRIERGSGNPVYDDTVFRAMRKTETGPPFPEPDASVYETIKDGYIFDFNPKDFFSGDTG